MNLIIALALAQTLTVAIPPNTPFQIQYEHDGSGNGYRMWCDGQIVKNFTNAEVIAGKSTNRNPEGNFTFTMNAPGLPAGPHDCVISALYGEMEQKSEPPLMIPIGNIPMKPINFKVLVKVG